VEGKKSLMLDMLKGLNGIIVVDGVWA